MNDNYMKTILSGVKEWTENLTDDAKDKANNALDKANNALDKANNALDKANNALDKANNALDKALFVVKITTADGETFNADKTFDEIVQVYNEGKYNIVANNEGFAIIPLSEMEPDVAIFSGIFDNSLVSFVILSDNTVERGIMQLAAKYDKLPNPYPLTFTGAVNETYDGSSAKTITIPDTYSKSDIDAIMGSYITDIDTLVGGNA